MLKKTLTVAALLTYAGFASAHAVVVAAVPEIDGALSIQAIALMGGLVYLLKRKK